MPIEAGKYDPTPAIIYQPVTNTDNYEPIQTGQEYCKQYIRFPQTSRWSSETQSFQQVQSQSQQTIRMRRTPKTLLIDATMEIHHEGVIYGVVGISPIPSQERDEIEFAVQYRKASVLVTN